MHRALACGLAGVLLSALIAGCTAPPSADGLTAKEAQTRGQPRAQAWKLDARLAGLAAIEAREGSALPQGWIASGRGPAAGLAVPAPDRALDGRAGEWYLHYTSPTTNATLEVLVAANGTVASVEVQRGRSGLEEGDLVQWAVDSVAAFDAALGDGNFSAAARAADGGVAYALAPRGGEGRNAADPFWIVTAASVQAGTGAWVFVNARTGERLPVSLPFSGFNASSAPPPPGSHPPPQNLSWNGTLTAAEPLDEFPFQVALGHRDIVLDATWNATA
ncbi:MAG TPA: hypothetical protein VGR28_07205, partial [Candidatus Thermoplasmatota archaeon]|nr:hypothetical protein [Candidatus Thermoplasmatota archaeon]